MKNFAMNSVHEPGPNGDLEPIPSRKTRSKTKPGARAPKLAHLGTQARTGARMPGRVMGATAMSWPSCSVVSRPAWTYRRGLRAVSRACARRHSRIVVCLATHCPTSSSPSCRNTLYCIAMQFQPNQTTVIQYTLLQYSLLSAHLSPPCHDTLSVL